MEKCQRLAAASVFSALVSLEAGRSFSALLSEASVFDSAFDSLWEEALSSLDSLCEALVDSALDSAFDSLVDADALEAELAECSELLPEVVLAQRFDLTAGDIARSIHIHPTLSEVVKEIAKRKPLRAVFRDSSFADSPSKINVEEIFKLLAPGTSVKVI